MMISSYCGRRRYSNKDTSTNEKLCVQAITSMKRNKVLVYINLFLFKIKLSFCCTFEVKEKKKIVGNERKWLVFRVV